MHYSDQREKDQQPRQLPDIDCEICKQFRPWSMIDVLSVEFDHPNQANMMQRNINFCIDNGPCRTGAIKRMADFIRNQAEQGLTVAKVPKK